VLIFLLFLVYELLPESLDGIMSLLDLPKRTKKGMVKDGFIKVEKPDEKPPENGKKAKEVPKEKTPPPEQAKDKRKTDQIK
jgi:hypothetical protein